MTYLQIHYRHIFCVLKKSASVHPVLQMTQQTGKIIPYSKAYTTDPAAERAKLNVSKTKENEVGLICTSHSYQPKF